MEFNVEDIQIVLQQAIDAGYITEDESARLAGLFIARAMTKAADDAS